jgi:hypothetical protein
VKVLGLDPSLTNYGWALHDTKGSETERCLDRGRFRTKPRDFSDDISRYLYLREQLRDLIGVLNPDAMGIEHPVFNENFSEGMYGLFLFSLEAIRGCQKDVVFFAPPQVKSFAKELLGRPRKWIMSKADMCDAARVDSGKGRWNHNEADAYLVSRAAGRFWELQRGEITEGDLTPVEKRTFTLIHKFVKGKRAGELDVRGILHRESERFFLWSQTVGDSK